MKRSEVKPGLQVLIRVKGAGLVPAVVVEPFGEKYWIVRREDVPTNRMAYRLPRQMRRTQQLRTPGVDPRLGPS